MNSSHLDQSINQEPVYLQNRRISEADLEARYRISERDH